jgi:hypothetical protein
MRGRGSQKEAKAASEIKAAVLSPKGPQPLRVHIVGLDRSLPVVCVHAAWPWLPSPVLRLPGETLEQLAARVLHLVEGGGRVVLHLMHGPHSRNPQPVAGPSMTSPDTGNSSPAIAVAGGHAIKQLHVQIQ